MSGRLAANIRYLYMALPGCHITVLHFTSTIRSGPRDPVSESLNVNQQRKVHTVY